MDSFGGDGKNRERVIPSWFRSGLPEQERDVSDVHSFAFIPTPHGQLTGDHQHSPFPHPSQTRGREKVLLHTEGVTHRHAPGEEQVEPSFRVPETS